jgi:hypothetical protein
MAIADFLALGVKPKVVVNKPQLYRMLGVHFPGASEKHGRAKKLELQFLARFVTFRNRLLREHSVCLVSNNAGGYFIMPPREQAVWAQEEMGEELRAAFRKARDRAHFVKTTELDDAGRNERRSILSEIANRARAAGALLRKTARYRDAAGEAERPTQSGAQPGIAEHG